MTKPTIIKIRSRRHIGKESCLGKTRWTVERSAQEFVTRIKERSPEMMGSNVRPYRCSRCKKWHLGHEE